MRAKCYVSRGSEDSGHAKIGARANKGKEQEGAQCILVDRESFKIFNLHCFIKLKINFYC